MPKKGAGPVVPASGQLGALGVEIIHQYAGQEQVDLTLSPFFTPFPSPPSPRFSPSPTPLYMLCGTYLSGIVL